MPGIIQEPSPEGLTIKELHPTFGAEIEGVDFENLTEAQFGEIKAALSKVRSHTWFYAWFLSRDNSGLEVVSISRLCQLRTTTKRGWQADEFSGHHEAYMIFLSFGSTFQPNVTPHFAASHGCLT